MGFYGHSYRDVMNNLTKDNKQQTYSSWQFRPAEWRVVLVLGDFIVALIALFIGLYFWGIGDIWFGFSAQFLKVRVPEWFYAMPLVWILLLLELYDVHRLGDWQATVKGIGVATLIGFGLYLVIFFSVTNAPRSMLPRRGVAGFVISASLLSLLWRYLFYYFLTTRQFLLRRAVIVGAGRTGKVLLRVLTTVKPSPFIIIGFVDDDNDKVGKNIDGYSVLGDSSQLLAIIQEHQVTDLLVAILGEIGGTMFQSLLDAQERGVDVTNMTTVYQELLNRVPIEYLDANWLLRSFAEEAHKSIFYRMAKRVLDVAGGMVGVTFLAVIFIPIALAILLETGLPIFYIQTRLGRGGKPYRMIKFRTMRQDAEADGKPKWAEENDERVTRLGRFLRKTHLDEIPQFVNVLLGDMSLVGPRAERPELVESLQKTIPFYRARLLVKPGITGWAQLNYGYVATVKDTMVKLEYDLYYIKHRSLLMDILIILRTPWTVFGFRGR